MSYLQLQNVTKQFGSFTAVNNFNLSVEKGEMIALLGGSGCGKTTTLRMIAGFASVTSGDISINGQKVNDVPSYKRNIGIVFQNYALFPHLTVYDNIAFGLKIQKLPKADIKEKVNRVLEMVHLSGLESRLPRELSGGQQQRVALARALVMEPTLLLLDEPLSNLDAKLRVEMQVEIKRIQRESGITTILVTHDQEEALSLAERIVIMNEGVIQQTGSVRDIYEQPENRFVADFMGVSNFVEGTVAEASGNIYSIKASTGEVIKVQAADSRWNAGDSVVLGIRPDHVALADGPGENTWQASVASTSYKGSQIRVFAEPVLGIRACVDADGKAQLSYGDNVYIHFPAQRILLFPGNS